MQCDNCDVMLENEVERKLHENNYQFGCEDCRLCFKSEHQYDVHELNEHPEVFYAHHNISDPAVRQFTKNFRNWFNFVLNILL